MLYASEYAKDKGKRNTVTSRYSSCEKDCQSSVSVHPNPSFSLSLSNCLRKSKLCYFLGPNENGIKLFVEAKMENYFPTGVSLSSLMIGKLSCRKKCVYNEVFSVAIPLSFFIPLSLPLLCPLSPYQLSFTPHPGPGIL